MALAGARVRGVGTSPIPAGAAPAARITNKRHELQLRLETRNDAREKPQQTSISNNKHFL